MHQPGLLLCLRICVSGGRRLTRGQRAKVDFVIHTLPCIRFAAAVNDTCFNFKLREGLSAETSGGLLAMCVTSPCLRERAV